MPGFVKGLLWKPSIKGGPMGSFEISIVREDFSHGFKSYGWFGEKKLNISGGEYVLPLVFDALVFLAQKVSEQINTWALSDSEVEFNHIKFLS